ncbi:uncharacterized protein LOC131022672 [Salvia miltiorrhiza]|uniref:uncharacterized protein LOC131022672 n=1 Tax=Salvia miltiorrhiza TaxID=226208 RepID=UPI0025AC05B2|nr:uncharacterized protein LOC131022672 [Salvia miltiorrhiza]
MEVLKAQNCTSPTTIRPADLRRDLPPPFLPPPPRYAASALHRSTHVVQPCLPDSPLSLCRRRRLLCLDEQGSHPGLSQVKGESHTNRRDCCIIYVIEGNQLLLKCSSLKLAN